MLNVNGIGGRRELVKSVTEHLKESFRFERFEVIGFVWLNGFWVKV
ncbi:MAG: hypothetical protein ACTS5F_01505 [Candidatus Hodgkinia cicadicola]